MSDKQKGRTSQETENSTNEKNGKNNAKKHANLKEQKLKQRAFDMEEPDIWNLPKE